MVQPIDARGFQLTPDLGGLGQGIAGLLQNRQKEQLRQEQLQVQQMQQQQINQARDIFSFTTSVLEQPPELRRQALTSRLAQAMQTGNEEEAIELQNMLQLDDVALEQDLREDQIEMGNLLGVDLRQMGGAGAGLSGLNRILGVTEIETDTGDIKKVIPVFEGGKERFVEVGKSPKLTPMDEAAQEVALVEQKEKIKTREARLKKKEEGLGSAQATRIATTIEQGITAADSIPIYKRALELLNQVDTGGVTNIALLRAKQLFGVEGADEGELSANLGKAVLSQLRPTFGAAFTKAEGDTLARIEAGFGKNAKTNRRLLEQAKQIAERAVNRAIETAVKNKEFEAAKQLQEALDFQFKFEDETVQPKFLGFE